MTTTQIQCRCGEIEIELTGINSIAIAMTAKPSTERLTSLRPSIRRAR